jgi:fluoride ion exporter CrcB/FEX
MQSFIILILSAILGGLLRAFIGYLNHKKSMKSKDTFLYWLLIVFLSAIVGFCLNELECLSPPWWVSFLIAYTVIDLLDKEA